MSRYIKADDLKKEMDELEGWFKDLKWKVENLDADVAEVVRCKDCKWYDGNECFEQLGLVCARDEDFCSWGERREDEQIH